jgi:hypothetical protein
MLVLLALGLLFQKMFLNKDPQQTQVRPIDGNWNKVFPRSRFKTNRFFAAK